MFCVCPRNIGVFSCILLSFSKYQPTNLQTTQHDRGLFCMIVSIVSLFWLAPQNALTELNILQQQQVTEGLENVSSATVSVSSGQSRPYQHLDVEEHTSSSQVSIEEVTDDDGEPDDDDDDLLTDYRHTRNTSLSSPSCLPLPPQQCANSAELSVPNVNSSGRIDMFDEKTAGACSAARPAVSQAYTVQQPPDEQVDSNCANASRVPTFLISMSSLICGRMLSTFIMQIN